MPIAATTHVTTSSTVCVFPVSASVITAVYEPAIANRIVEWSTRLSRAVATGDSRPLWYTALTASIAVTHAP